MKEEIKTRFVGIFLTELRNTTLRLKAHKNEGAAYDWIILKKLVKDKVPNMFVKITIQIWRMTQVS
jgi:hypothetical protein